MAHIPDPHDADRERRANEEALIGNYRPRPRWRWMLFPRRFVDDIVAYNEGRQVWRAARRKEMGLAREHPVESPREDPELSRALARLEVLQDSLGIVGVLWSATQPRLIEVSLRRRRPRYVRRVEELCRPIDVRVIEGRSQF